MPLNLYKKAGETPLERLERLREEDPQYKDAVLSYAGRLDPLAEGVMLVLVGSENKRREKYLSMDKSYMVDVLFGFATDTHDVLGLVEDISTNIDEQVLIEKLVKILASYVGSHQQEYPLFSSKAVKGKPLFQWTKEGKLNEIKIPKKKIEIYELEAVLKKIITKEELATFIEKTIEKVHGDFRQEAILLRWKKALAESNLNTFPIVTLNIACSSGTYMRTLAHQIGKKLATPALALRIVRTSVGKWDMRDAIE